MSGMRQEFTQKQEQRLQQVLAPELRQSLQYLQVPVLELQNLIQQELEVNPTLEEKPLDMDQIEVETGTSDLSEEAAEDGMGENFELLARLDDDWRDLFRQNRIITSQKDSEHYDFMMASLTESESLNEHLLEQLKYLGLSDRDRSIAEMVIGNIDGDGYLGSTLEELSDTTGVGLHKLEQLLDVIQEFHPVGVGARSLEECLKLQLQRLGVEDELVYRVADKHLENLGKKKYSQIATSEKCSLERVNNIAELIHTLEPKPGRIFGEDTTAYVHPEATIQKVNGNYTVIMHNEYIPRLRISEMYKKMMRDPKTPPESKDYIKNKIQGAIHLLRSINQRQGTLESICRLILEVQIDFMDNGMSGLKPLVMSDIAARMGVHETTVSRAISNKYIRTPQGVLEMKFFFNPGYKKSDGSQVSSRTIMEMIRNMINSEDPADPLSDQTIVARLAEEGFNVARRTVAKYRTKLRIPSSHQRKIS